jgi:RNA polymerase sigma-B factor
MSMPATLPPATLPRERGTNRIDEATAFREYRDSGDRVLRDALFERMMPLAHQVALRYQASHEPLDDLLQVARVGLLKAIERFDPDRGVRFSSYAVPTVAGELKRYFRDTSWSVHLPRGLQERVLRVEDAQRRLAARTDHAPSIPEVALEAGLTIEQALEAFEASSARESRSLDEPAGGRHDDGEVRTVATTLGQDDPGYELVEDRAAIAAALSCLTRRERVIVELRFRHEMTQAQIADRIGVSQMQVSRLLRRCLSKLREVADHAG